MADYMDREKLLAKIDEAFFETDPDGKEQIGVLKCRAIIREIPAADVAPVVHGRWEAKGYVCGESEFECSACHKTEWRTTISQFKFCPFCGARMDGDAE